MRRCSYFDANARYNFNRTRQESRQFALIFMSGCAQLSGSPTKILAYKYVRLRAIILYILYCTGTKCRAEVAFCKSFVFDEFWKRLDASFSPKELLLNKSAFDVDDRKRIKKFLLFFPIAKVRCNSFTLLKSGAAQRSELRNVS